MTGPYDDMINLPHHVSKAHPQMSLINRAAQFAPFAALTGYDAAVKEAARLTGKRIALDEDALDDLAMKLRVLADRIADHPEIVITYFRPDDKKEGGAYVTSVGAVKRIDDYERAIVLVSGEKIMMEDILDIACELFKDLI